MARLTTTWVMILAALTATCGMGRLGRMARDAVGAHQCEYFRVRGRSGCLPQGRSCGRYGDYKDHRSRVGWAKARRAEQGVGADCHAPLPTPSALPPPYALRRFQPCHAHDARNNAPLRAAESMLRWWPAIPDRGAPAGHPLGGTSG